jgi:hypothetical protein
MRAMGKGAGTWVVHVHYCTEHNGTITANVLNCRISFGTFMDMKKTAKKRPGRPRKSSHQLKAEYLDVRLDLAEKRTFRDAADLAGLPISTWVRDRLRAAAIRELEAASRPIAFFES